MRTLELNKSSLWYVKPDGIEVKLKDEDGYYTGEIEIQYEEPSEIRLHLYPASGEIKEQTFGLSVDIDMITSSTDVVLEKNGLIFINEPTDNYDVTYDYKVGSILKSLNSYQYGLKGRM